MSKKGGGSKGKEETKLEVLARIAPKKFFAYGIPVHGQFIKRIQAYLEEDTDLDQVVCDDKLHIWEDAGPNAIKAMFDAIHDSG